MYNLKRLFFLF